MLLHLRIRDFAIIDEAELEFPEGFTVVTGETGAGKSILVDALSLVLGGRASGDVVRSGAESAQVEALFDISQHPVVRARLEQRELIGDDLDTLLIRRVISPRGRGKVFINGHLATVQNLGEIVRGLVDISGQHEQQSLLVVEGHPDILDAYGQLDDLRAEYRRAYDELRAVVTERARLATASASDMARADYLSFQLEEIRRVDPKPGEDEAIEQERRRLGHAEKLLGGAQLAEGLLYAEDGSAFDKLGKALAEVEALARIDATLAPCCESLASARREIEEVARALQRYADGVEVDPVRLEEVEGRAAELYRLSRKHGGTLAEVLVRADEIARELDSLDNSEARLEELRRQAAAAATRARALAGTLTERRREAARRLGEAVRAELSEMDLEGAVFEARIEPRRASPDTGPGDGDMPPDLGPNGADDVELLWSANPGEPPRPLAKIASGGELSRLMLAVKTVLCNRDLVSLYVFDEVDSGLGGRAADCIGRKIQAVSRGHQAITITHLAPIAARADHHLLVTKAVQEGEEGAPRTVSSFSVVRGSERLDEIARMIDGANITKATRQAARQMLARAR